MRKLAVTLVIILALVLLAASCSSDDGSSPADGGSSSQEGATDVSGMTEVDLEAVNFSFAPAVLQGTAGQTLTIHVTNAGSATHTFTIDDQSVDAELAAGDSADVDVAFPDSGSVEFYCRFHESSGMTGELTVA